MRIVEGWQPIGRKLPLLISGLLVVVMAAFSWSAYRQIERALVAAAGERFVGVSQRLASLLEESARRMRAEARGTASDSSVTRALAHADRASLAAARVTLEQRRAASPQLTAIQLFDARRHMVLGAGAGNTSASIIDQVLSDTHDSSARAVALGPIIAAGDTVSYFVVTPIVRAGRDTLGFLVEHRQLNGGGQGKNSAQVIGQLIGADAVFMLGDTTAQAWTDMAKRTAGPPHPLRIGAAVQYTGPHGQALIGAAARIARTPWAVWVETPRASVLAPAREFLLRTGAIGLLIILLGTLAAWLLTRHVTAPLAELTRAAEDIAAGDYTRRVAVGRSDELGRLSASFNSMARQVGDSTHLLEARVESRTLELRRAMEELRSAQDELLRRERLAILGQLAGGVGHELRNPLGVMTNALYYLGAVLRDAPANVTEYLGILRTQVTLSEKIVGDLLDYARVKEPRREAIAVGELVHAQLARVAPPAGVRVEVDIPADLPPVRADRTQIGQVLLNLITNAVQAMDGTGDPADAAGTLTLRGRGAGGVVQLDVIDSGGGIAPEHMTKLFEPLFTTKPRGIGLGLAVSRALVRANGGEIAVASQRGAGATFSVTLPRADRARDGNGA